jgi:hypothetical protein
MDVSSWKRGFALFVFAAVSLSSLAVSASLAQRRHWEEYVKRSDKSALAPAGSDDGGDYTLYLTKVELEPSAIQIVMQVVLSIIATAASLFVILATRFGPKDKHWAYATVGTILGFWLHGGLK